MNLFKIWFGLIMVIIAFNSAMSAQTAFSYYNFTDESGLALNGNAQVFKNILRLNPSAIWQRSSVYYASKVPLQNGFETVFMFRVSGLSARGLGGGDGFAFVIQNDSIGATGGPGGSMGYGDASFPTTYAGISNSVAIEFDAFKNFENNDPSDNHISIQTRGTQPNSPNHNYSLASQSNIPKLNDGSIHIAKISYSSGSLKVYVDDLTNPAISLSFDLSSLLSLDAGNAWIGFTSGTGLAFESHDILMWDFSTNSTAFDNLLVSSSAPVATNKIFLKWTPIQNAIGYKLYRSTASSTSGFSLLTSGLDSTNYTDHGLNSNTIYFYKITYVNASGTESASSNVTAATTSLNLTSTPTGDNQVSLSWQSVPFASYYQILAATLSDSMAFVVFDSSNATNYLTKTLQAAPYWIKIYAIGTNHNVLNESNVIYAVPSGNGIKVTFQADISDLISIGFDPTTDTLEVRGDTYPLSWYGGTMMYRETFNPNFDSLTVSFYVSSGSVINYKFHALPATKFENTGWELSDNVSFTLSSADTVLLPRKPFILTDVSQHRYDMPTSYTLSQNFPNPFNPSTTIAYDLPEKSHVVIAVYDVLGRQIRTLVDEEKPAGRYQVVFSAEGGSASGGDAGSLPSGMYFYKITARQTSARFSTGSFTDTKKLLLVK